MKASSVERQEDLVAALDIAARTMVAMAHKLATIAESLEQLAKTLRSYNWNCYAIRARSSFDFA